MKSYFDLSKEEMKAYGYKIIDHLVAHFDTIEEKKPVSSASRAEMDSIFTRSSQRTDAF